MIRYLQFTIYNLQSLATGADLGNQLSPLRGGVGALLLRALLPAILIYST